nr:electron transfer flavoprotein subunit alpha/FixB family protein [Nocardioidaceae bacterium]
MSEVLVLVDHVEGQVTKPTFELLAIARRLGEPSAVFIGGSGEAGSALQSLKKYGAEKVYTVDDADTVDFLVAPKAEVLAQLVEKTSPAAVLIVSGGEGKEIAGRLAVKTESGLITDAVDVRADDGAPVTTQSVFAGSYTVQARVTRGTPVITVKPNSAAPQEADAAGVQEAFEVTVSDVAKTARVTASEPRKASGRPELTEAAIVVSG